MKRKAHPYADLFPMMSEDELAALTEDIKANGLRQPIVLYNGDVLDGRNRLLACERAEVEPRFEDYEGDDAAALALVISLNVQRRDLTAGQKAIVAAKRWGLNGYSEGGRPAKGKPLSPTTVSVRQLAKQFHIGEKSVTQARDLNGEAPDLADEVWFGTQLLGDAYKALQKRREEAAQRERDLKLIEAYDAYHEAVQAGKMTIEEAKRKALEEMRAEEVKAKEDASARRIWFDGLQSSLTWIAESVGTREDDFLAWYTKEGEPGTQHDITEDQVSAAIGQLKRIIKITLRR